MASIYDWSTTAASNASSDSDITWAEGQAPSTVNNSARQMMGRLAELVGDLGGALAAGGTANGILITANSAFTTYANGRVVAFKAASDNTGAVTLNVNGVGSKAIRKFNSSGDVALVAGDIKANGIYVTRYNTSLNGGAGAWQLLNAPGVSTSAANTWSGVQTFTGFPLTLQNTSIADGGKVMFFDVHRDFSIYRRGATDATAALSIESDVSGNPVQIGFMGTPIAVFNTDLSVSIPGGALDVSGGISAAGNISTTSGGINSDQAFRSTSTSWLAGTSAAGTMLFRPNGTGSTSGQMSLASDGTVTATSFSGAGGSLTGLNAGNVSSGTLASARLGADVWRDGDQPSSAQLEAILGNAYAGFSLTGSSSTTSFPIGQYLMANLAAGSNTRNAATNSIRLGTTTSEFTTVGTGGILSGTWRAKGSTEGSNYTLINRTA